MKNKKTIIVLFLFFSAPIVLYLLNPTGTASYDPRARLLGFIPYQIPSSSMAPTLQTGDYIVVSTIAYMFDEPQINDVIVFKYPEDRSIAYIKRIVALPEQTLSIVAGKVIVDGKAIDQSYVDPDKNVRSSEHDIGPVAVPKGMLFVLGDYRDNSRDSRYWGFVPRSDVIGKVKMVWISEDTSRIGESVK